MRSVLVLLCCLAGPAFGQNKPAAQPKPGTQTKPPVQLALEKIFVKYDASISKRDLTYAIGIMTENFRGITGKNQEYNKTGAAANLRGLVSQFLTLKSKTKIIRFKLVDGKAQIECTNVLDASGKTPQGQPVKLHGESTTAETWVPVKGSWQVSAIRTLAQTVFVNGKRIE